MRENERAYTPHRDMLDDFQAALVGLICPLMQLKSPEENYMRD